ncbi:MAG: hypothetical protein ABR957_00835 [Terracidiphilus sp.]|jgi:hypothetical protein
MTRFALFASPWWVNLLILVPVAPYLLARKAKFTLGRRRLLVIAVFGIAFGFVEAAVVVYLRAATGLWPVPQAYAPAALPQSLVGIECFREAATIVMLGGIAWLAGQNFKARAAAFLWTFAFWDFFYYVWLRVTIGWPGSLVSPDILFLIPTPWLAQVWFPLVISSLTAAVIWSRS